MRLASGPNEPLLDDDPRRARVPAGGGGELRDRALGVGRRVADRDALAGRQPVRLDDDTATGRRQLGREGRGRRCVHERLAASHPDAGRGRDLVAERLARLDPRRRGGRPEHREARLEQRVGDAGGERRLGSDDDQLGRFATGDRHDRGGVERVDPRHAAHAWLEADRVAAGRDDDLVDTRLGRQLPGQRVLAAAPTDDEDAGRRDEAHAGSPGLWRIGRQARSMVWVRSGPTETRTIGTPACSSIADT